MAEIHIEKKKKKPIWPWMLGALLAAIIIWFVIDSMDDNENQTVLTEPVQQEQSDSYTDQQEIQSSEAVEDFVTFVRDGNARQEMDIDHNYTAEGIMLLSKALNDMVDQLGIQDINIQEKKEDLKNTAERIQKDPESTQHADVIRSAFVTSAEVIDGIQKEHFPDLQKKVEDIKESAQAVEPGTQTLNQKENVKAFFSSSAQALNEMSENNVNIEN